MFAATTEYSTAVPDAQQRAALSGPFGAITQFLQGVAGIAQPIAQTVATFEAAKNPGRQTIGEGAKAPTPVVATPGNVSTATTIAGLDRRTVVTVAVVVGLLAGGALLWKALK